MRTIVSTPLPSGGMQTNPDRSPTTSALAGSLNSLRLQMNDLAHDINAMQATLAKILSDLDQVRAALAKPSVPSTAKLNPLLAARPSLMPLKR